MSNPLLRLRLGKIQPCRAILPHRRQVSAAKLSRPRNGCSAPSAPSPPAWKNPALPRDPSAPGAGALQKKALNERSEVEKPIKRVLCTPAPSPPAWKNPALPRDPSAPFLDRAFQLRCRLLKANTQAARVSESRPIQKRCFAPPRSKKRSEGARDFSLRACPQVMDLHSILRSTGAREPLDNYNASRTPTACMWYNIPLNLWASP